MEAVAVAATIKVVLENLISVSWDEFSLIRGLDKDAQKLKTSLATIQGYLNDADNKFITQDAVKTWLKDLEAVAFDADRVLDELSYHLLHNKVNTIKPSKDKVLSFFSSFNNIARPQKLARRIQRINMNVESINKRATELGLESIVVNAPVAAPAAVYETDSFTLDPIFIGRVDDVSILADKLMRRAEGQKFSTLAIVGMGGMGKTTLARKLFNHQNIKTQFASLLWVHVSQTFDPIILLNKILSTLTSQFDGAAESREVILKKLQEALHAKTYLLVLDDVWNQDHQKWEDFVYSLSGVTSTMGNGIIVTTRNAEVASTVNALYVHHLNGLSNKECWSIIKTKAFQNRDFVTSKFEIIGVKIAARCQGLPLAANVVGGVLRSKSEDEWLSVQQNWLPSVEGDNISNILRLSFDNLPSPSLKKCFAHCSIFPKGEVIMKQELVELWMAEGFLQPYHINDMESVGDKFLNILLHNSLLQVAWRDDYGDVEMCVMHDLVHDLACSVLGSSRVDGNNADGTSQVRYISHEHYRGESSPIPKEVAKYLRSLLIEGEVYGTMLSGFKCLHSLTLTSYQVRELPQSIRKMIHLRNLNISRTSIEYLPEWIGELYHLQTLRAETGSLRELPSTLKYLINLRHLYIDDDVELPAEIGRLTSLQTLTQFTVDDKKGNKIEELGSLKNIKGELLIRSLEKVHGKEEAAKANIFLKPNLSDLRFEWGEYFGKGERNDEKVLEWLQPHPNLKKLGIYNFRGKRFPPWTLKMGVRDEPQGSWIGLNKLMNIELSRCVECEEIPALGHLPNLKSLTLKYLSNVKSINSSFYGIDNINVGGCKETTINVFPTLERLVLYDMPKLTDWAQVESGANHQVKVFSQLQYLEIDSCKQLISAPTHFPPCLKQLQIGKMGCPIPLANIFGVKLTSLTALSINGFELECLPDWLFHNNQNLIELEIISCPELRELPDGLHTLSSLEKVIIKDCRNLRSIGNPSGHGSLTSLHSLEILECPELVALPCEIVESSSASLETLSLVRLRSLRNLPMVFDCLTKAINGVLRQLIIVEFPQVMDMTSDVETWTFRNLERLKIGDSDDRSRETVDAILQGCCHSLTWLELEGMQCLPQSIQNLTALNVLKLENLGEQELPEWLGNLSSLEGLYLFNCNNLRRLPSGDAMQRLTKLQLLSIKHCPELHIDSKFTKNSHLSIRIL